MRDDEEKGGKRVMSLEECPLMVNLDRLLKAGLSNFFNSPVSLLTVCTSFSLFVLDSVLPNLAFPSPLIPDAPYNTPSHTHVCTRRHTHCSSQHYPFFTRSHLGFLVSICRGLASCPASCNPRSLQLHIHSRGKALMSTCWP